MLILIPDHFEFESEGPVLHINVPLIIVALALASGTVVGVIALAWGLLNA